MTNQEFSEFLDKWYEEVKSLREAKAKEYGADTKAFQNFFDGSRFLQIPPQFVAMNYMTKHIVSLYDIFSSQETYKAKRKYLKEKVNDIILYLLIILALDSEETDNAS